MRRGLGFSPFLHDLAGNQARQAPSRHKRVVIEATREDDCGEPVAQEQNSFSEMFSNTLAKLPEDQRTVLLLVAVEDLA